MVKGIEAAATEAASALRKAARFVTTAMETLTRDLVQHNDAVRASLAGFAPSCDARKRPRPNNGDEIR